MQKNFPHTGDLDQFFWCEPSGRNMGTFHTIRRPKGRQHIREAADTFTAKRWTGWRVHGRPESAGRLGPRGIGPCAMHIFTVIACALSEDVWRFGAVGARCRVHPSGGFMLRLGPCWGVVRGCMRCLALLSVGGAIEREQFLGSVLGVLHPRLVKGPVQKRLGAFGLVALPNAAQRDQHIGRGRARTKFGRSRPKFGPNLAEARRHCRCC